MNEKNSMDSTVDTKKVWTAPVIETVELNSARHQNLIGSDGGGTRTRS